MALRGEWWIDETGQTLFADGDIGDMDHKGYVIDGLVRSILEALHIDYREEFTGTAEWHDKAIREALNLDKEAANEEVRNALMAAVVSIWPNEDQREAAIAAAYDEEDPRLYAVQYDGWKRVQGNNVETWTLTQDDLRAIADGVSDIAGYEVDDAEVFCVEIRKTGRFFENVPWRVLATGDPVALQPYRTV